MFLNIFKLFLVIYLSLFSCAFSDSITFMPPDGWIKSESLSIKKSLLVFTPLNQSSGNPVEYLIIKTKKLNTGADSLLLNNLIDLKNNYSDFNYYQVKYTSDDAIGVGCSVIGGFCTVLRVEKFNDSLFVYNYTNNSPHYSQGFIGKWINICAQIYAGRQPVSGKNLEVFEI